MKHEEFLHSGIAAGASASQALQIVGQFLIAAGDFINELYPSRSHSVRVVFDRKHRA